MPSVTRRRFLQTVALESGVAAAQTALNPTTVLAGWGQQPAEDNTLFIQGEIVTINLASRIFVLNEQSDTPVTIEVSKDARIWKGEVTELTSLAIGDFLFLRALPKSDGTFSAVKIWANIFNLMGTVAAIDAGGFQLQIEGNGTADKNRLIAARFRQNMTVNDESRNLPSLKAGQPVQVLGVVENDGTLGVTRLWTTE